VQSGSGSDNESAAPVKKPKSSAPVLTDNPLTSALMGLMKNQQEMLVMQREEQEQIRKQMALEREDRRRDKEEEKEKDKQEKLERIVEENRHLKGKLEMMEFFSNMSHGHHHRHH